LNKIKVLDTLKFDERAETKSFYDPIKGIFFQVKADKRMEDRYLQLLTVKMEIDLIENSDSEEEGHHDQELKLKFAFITETNLDVGEEALKEIQLMNQEKGKGVKESTYPVKYIVAFYPQRVLCLLEFGY
jgi:hypothetical protein